MKRVILFLLPILVLAAVGLGFYFYKQQDLEKTALVEPSPVGAENILPPQSVPPKPSISPSPSGEIYQQNNIKFVYSKNLAPLVAGDRGGVSLIDQQKIIAEHQQYAQEGGCPGTCGVFASDPDLLLKQFEILQKVKNSPQCNLSPELIAELKQNFILFTNGSGQKFDINSIKTTSGECGLRIIESSGFDVSINNFHYKAGFILDNGNVIQIIWPLFPHNVFENIDKIWQEIGYNSADQSCDASCYENEVKYFENFDINDQSMKEVIGVYDQVVRTVELER